MQYHAHKSPNPNIFKGQADVEGLIQRRQQLEVMLAWDLLEAFNKPALLLPLQEWTLNVVMEMLAMSELSDAYYAIVQSALDEEKHTLRILRRIEVHLSEEEKGKYEKLNKGIFRPQQLLILVQDLQEDLANKGNGRSNVDAQFCSEIIRLYGTFVEQAAKKGLEKYVALDKEKGSYRVEIEEGKKYIWGKNYKEDEFGRHRYNIKRKHNEEEWREIKYAIARRPRGAVQNFLQSMGGGQRLFALADTSTVGRINRVFGLVPASDISGTTTDTLFFFKYLEKSLNLDLDPIFYLLPLATIVAGAHHSLLEVALALSLNEEITHIDYHIGFYESLMPKSLANDDRHVVSELNAALLTAQKHPFNTHMLIAYKDNNHFPVEIEGCYEMDPFRDTKYKEFTKSTNILNRIKHLSAHPTDKELTSFCKEGGLILAEKSKKLGFA